MGVFLNLISFSTVLCGECYGITQYVPEFQRLAVKDPKPPPVRGITETVPDGALAYRCATR